ncbi:NGG1p interacting factor NIF3 [Alkalimarinus sediminis]|uniref:NGG1p interacting factor NIF3 n=1 Tax=Alkalimarinus sediminis TaxID=1632866 RepID=A0A9E8HVR4_9ALTE|nr:NGG1p interacting factor NIF3 [Alkalimarinus sediminis]UZW76694.1 NGG1p interacting factor NIF3 [Alkalimarinus sediminis]
MYKISFYVPEMQLEPVKHALFKAGAGKIGDYEHCCWQVKGVGQFKPLAGSQPFIGEVGRCEVLDEYKVEMVCDSKFITEVIESLKQAHPYEEPAYEVIELLDF